MIAIINTTDNRRQNAKNTAKKKQFITELFVQIFYFFNDNYLIINVCQVKIVGV